MARALIVCADGGSRGNPGVAGYGAVVFDAATGTVLAERAEPLGLASNNVAEYSGLIAGLRAAAQIDASAEIEARLDSKLVVEQLSGRWKIKHADMRRLALEARDLVGEIVSAGGSVRFEWIPRAENAHADRLSNVAMDGESVSRDHWRSRPDDAATEVDSDDAATEAAETTEVDAATEVDVAAGASEAVAAPAVDLAMGTAPLPDGRGSVTRLVLVRHGVTAFTEQARLDGRGGFDPPLSQTGREQAQRAAQSVAALLGGAAARVVTSSLLRARETGAAVADALGVLAEVDADFDEQGFGDWDGAAISDLLRDAPEDLLRFRHDEEYARPGGESHAQLQTRVSAAYERVVAGGGTAVVVCHRKPIMCVMAHILGLSAEASWRLAAAPGSLHAIEVWEDGTTSIAFTNRT